MPYLTLTLPSFTHSPSSIVPNHSFTHSLTLPPQSFLIIPSLFFIICQTPPSNHPYLTWNSLTSFYLTPSSTQSLTRTSSPCTTHFIFPFPSPFPFILPLWFTFPSFIIFIYGHFHPLTFNPHHLFRSFSFVMVIFTSNAYPSVSFSHSLFLSPSLNFHCLYLPSTSVPFSSLL